MDRTTYFTGTPKKRLKAKLQAAWFSFSFCSLFLLFWLLHVLVLGWFQYCFKPRMYVIKAGDILKDVEHPHGAVAHDFWWSRHHVEAAKKAAAMNEPENYIRFIERTHPFYLDNDLFYVKSKGYKARWFQGTEKLYPQTK